MSTFGGPHDLGMAADKDLALFTKADLHDPKYAYLFLPAPPPGTSGLGRRLNPDQLPGWKPTCNLRPTPIALTFAPGPRSTADRNIGL